MPHLVLPMSLLQPQLTTVDPTLPILMVIMTMLGTTIFMAQCEPLKGSCIDWRTGKGFLHVLLYLKSFPIIF